MFYPVRTEAFLHISQLCLALLRELSAPFLHFTYIPPSTWIALVLIKNDLHPIKSRGHEVSSYSPQQRLLGWPHPPFWNRFWCFDFLPVSLPTFSFLCNQQWAAQSGPGHLLTHFPATISFISMILNIAVLGQLPSLYPYPRSFLWICFVYPAVHLIFHLDVTKHLRVNVFKVELFIFLLKSQPSDLGKEHHSSTKGEN